MSPEIAIELRECVRGVRRLWLAVQARAEADRAADRELARALREAFTEEATP
jgi:hypothetical protein